MSRMRWVQIDGKLIPADEVTHERTGDAPTILADLPDFKSPIDGSVVRGRAGMRDHCARHDVVPTADLAGLPFKRTYQPTEPSREYREATKRTIAEVMNSRNY